MWATVVRPSFGLIFSLSLQESARRLEGEGEAIFLQLLAENSRSQSGDSLPTQAQLACYLKLAPRLLCFFDLNHYSEAVQAIRN